MAAPPDPAHLPMVFPPRQGEQPQSQQPPEDHEMDIEGADLGAADEGQLIAKTTSLTISDPGNDELESPAVAGNAITHSDRAGTLLSSVGYMCTDAQATLVTGREGRQDATGKLSATAGPGVSMPPLSPSPSESRPGTGSQPESPSVVVTNSNASAREPPRRLLDLPNEVLLHILGYLDVCDLLATSRTTHHLRTLSLTPYLHATRLRRHRAALPPLLTSPSRPTLSDLIRRSIFLTRTAFASRALARNLASIRLARRLAERPSAETLVQRCVLPVECLPAPARRTTGARGGLGGGALEGGAEGSGDGKGVSVRGGGNGRVRGEGKMRGGGGRGEGGGEAAVAPALVARKRAVERERVKDGLRSWVGSVWRAKVRLREEGVRRWEERAGVGRVWRLRRFWERVGRGEEV